MPSPSIELTSAQRSAFRRALNEFDSGAVHRGRQYVQDGRVRNVALLKGDPSPGFVARVQGSSTYQVEWLWHDEELEWDHECTCPVGYACKHAYAAAQVLLKNPVATQTGKPVPGGLAAARESSPVSGSAWKPPTASTAPASTEEAEVIRLLEHRHARELTKHERHLAHELTEVWTRVLANRTAIVTEAHLARVEVGPPRDLPHFFRGEKVAFQLQWDADTAPENPIILWQYLALFAEENGRPLPAVFKPITDLKLARDRIAVHARAQEMRRWTALLTRPRPAPMDPWAAPDSPKRDRLPYDIRLRFGSDRLLWECRETAGEPWQPVKGGRAREWLAALGDPSLTLPAPALALLQEVQLGKLRAATFDGTEAQTLKFEELRTRRLLRWLLQHPALRSQLVDRAGRNLREGVEPLRLRGRPDPERADQVHIALIRSDGTSVTVELIEVEGVPEWAIAPDTGEVFELPELHSIARNAGYERVPREVFQQPAVVRKLGRLGLLLEGIEVPEVKVIELRPRFVCRLKEDRDYSHLSSLWIELHGVTPEGRVAGRRKPAGTWMALSPSDQDAMPKPAAAEPASVYDYDRAEAAVLFFQDAACKFIAGGLHWSWLFDARDLPERFAPWAERVRAAGIEFESPPELAGLVRSADRARYDFTTQPATGEEGSGIDWFDVEVALRTDDATLTAEEIHLLLKARGGFVLLPTKGWRRMELDTDASTLARLAELGLDSARPEPGATSQRFHALQLADERMAGLLPSELANQVRERAAQLTAIAAPAVPPALTAELRPYQREGFHFLAHLSANGLGGVLADDMGLGKTVQALAWLLHLAAEKEVASGPKAGAVRANRKKSAKPFRALVVCPKSVVPNWESETKRFAPTLAVAPLAAREVPEGANLVVVNYTQLRLAADALNGVAWDAVILDEGQNIKNPQSQTAKIARELRATHRVVLTGTPIENRALDLWSLFAFAMPGLLGTQAAFRRAYNDKLDPAATRSRLARRVKHFLLRRTKSQVAADLPPRTEEDLFVELEGAQRRLYDAELKRARGMLRGVADDRALGAQRFNILQSLLRLRQICCDPRLVGFGGDDSKAPASSDGGDAASTAGPGMKSAAKRTRSAAATKPAAEDSAADSEKAASASPTVAGSAKLEALLDTLEPLVAEGHRVLVFSQFVSALELIAAELKAREISFLTLTGQTENRRELVEQFQSAEGPPVFLLSLKAAGAGLNLTAASYVVLFDPWWNPAVEAQAIDRTHRIGQRNAVIAYRLLARGTIEEKIRQLQRAKADLARAIVQEESLATVLNLDDLRFLLTED